MTCVKGLELYYVRHYHFYIKYGANLSGQQSAPQQNSPQAPSNETSWQYSPTWEYLSLSFLMAKNDPFVKFHVKQGLVLVIAEIAVWFLSGALWHFWMLIQLINLATLVLSIIGIVNVINHKEEELPVVGSIAHSFTF